MKASYDAAAQKLSLSVSPPPKFEADIRWKPLLQGDFKSFGDELRLSWDDIPKENVCRIFVCEVKIDGAKPKEIQMLADPDPDTPESAAKWADIWEKRFNAEIKKIPIEDEINFRMLLVENTEALYGTQVRLKENGGRNGGGGSMPQPPIFERLLELVLDQKLDHDRLKALFEPLQKREKDPSELCKAFGEMANFFGFHPDKEND